MGATVGIDLGTTYSVVAHVTRDGKPEVIRNHFERPITPSVIYFGDGEPVVGDQAKEFQAQGAQEVAAFFKREMGDRQFFLTFGGRDYSPVDLSALVLTYLKEQAERFLGTAVTDAVITVPAYFSHPQRQATIEAGNKAGLNVLSIMSEPTAAALAYGLRPGQSAQRVLVYDLGGGTFDISLVEITDDALIVKATDGDSRLGGKDWDERLVLYLQQRFQEEFGLELLGDDYNEVVVQAEKLKHALSAFSKAEVSVRAEGKRGRYSVTRAQFQDLTRDLVERTRQLTQHVLQTAGLTWGEIAGVIPVGGSTRMPMIRACIEEMSGKPPMGGINPDEAVALGAAIQATLEVAQKPGSSRPKSYLPGYKTPRDIIAHSLGMVALSEDGSRYLNSILIPKNAPIPAERTRPYEMRLRHDGETRLEVFLTQGESDDPQKCAYLGCYVFSAFPALSAPSAVLDITYSYDRNGVVQVAAVEHSTQTPLRMTVEPVPPDVPERFLRKPGQTYERAQMTCYLAFDLSGSMRGNPLDEAKNAAKAFVEQCDLATTSVGLIPFSDKVAVKPATQNHTLLMSAIEALRIGETGYGNLGQPFDAIYRHLQGVAGPRYAVVLTDGVWVGQRYAIERAKRCHREGIEIIAVGFGHADRKFLAQIASSSEQSFFTDLSRLTETFSTIARELTESGGKHLPRTSR